MLTLALEKSLNRVIKVSFRHTAMSLVKPVNACSFCKDEENTV